MKTSKIEVSHLLKMAEEDEYNEGCIPETCSMFDVDVSFKAETVEELIQSICDFLCIDNVPDNYQIDPCEDEPGRIDFQLMETGDGQRAYDSDMELWRKGKKKLWACTYTAKAQIVTREPLLLHGALLP